MLVCRNPEYDPALTLNENHIVVFCDDMTLEKLEKILEILLF